MRSSGIMRTAAAKLIAARRTIVRPSHQLPRLGLASRTNNPTQPDAKPKPMIARIAGPIGAGKSSPGVTPNFPTTRSRCRVLIESRPRPEGPLPVPPGENAILICLAGEAALALLRLPEGGRPLHLHPGH